jgi:hypothetical protein
MNCTIKIYIYLYMCVCVCIYIFFFMYDGVVYTDGGQKPLNVTLKRLGHKASRWVANMRRHDRCRMFVVGQLSDNWCCVILCGNWGLIRASHDRVISVIWPSACKPHTDLEYVFVELDAVICRIVRWLMKV